MNIPYCILKEQECISPKSFEYHQFLAKRLYKSSKSIKSSNKSPQKGINNYSKKKIYSWLFNLDFNIRMKICCIYNDWFSKILFQLLTYNEYDISIKFRPTKYYENFYKKLNSFFDEDSFNYKNYLSKEENSKANFNIYFDNISQDSSDKQANKNHIREKDFLKELKFISINEINDALTLSIELLKSKSKLLEYFDTFSNCKIFSETINAFKIKNSNNIFNFSLPNWVQNYKEFSIHQIIVICFEQIISIYYQIYLNDNAIPNFEIDSKINDLLRMNNNMENYIGKEMINPDIFNMDTIINEVNSPNQKKFIQYYENLSENVYTIAFNRERSEFFNDEDIKYNDINKAVTFLKKEYENNISNFVNNISFIDITHAFKIENIIYNFIYQKLSILCSQKNIDDLCNNDNEKPKNKKKKKKNKKQNKNLKKDENNDTDNIEINSINLDFEYSKENNINLKNNNLYQENNNEDYEYNNIDNNLHSINSVEKGNNSDDDEDNIFSNDCFNKYPESVETIGDNTNLNNKGAEYIIEMKDLNENGKEIKKVEDKEINGPDLLKELMEMDLKEKKKKKKRRRNKKKKETNSIEENDYEKNLSEKKEKEKEEINIINTESNNATKNIIKNMEQIKNENNLKENIIKEKINKVEENKNNKKKHKEFFLFTDNKKKKEKKNKQNLENNNIKNDKSNENEKEKEIIKSKEELSQTTIAESNKVEINSQSLNKNSILIETKESKIEFKGKKINNINKNDNEKSINIIDNSNKINYMPEYNKTQIINSNNPTINNYIIIEKEKDLFKNSPCFIDNFNYKMNNIFISQNPNAPNNFYPPLLPPFNYPMIYHQIPNYYLNEHKELFNNLSKELLLYEENINNNLDILKQYREKILNKIKFFITKILKENNFISELINYGSYETKLSIEASDIDILIKFFKINNNLNLINSQQHLEELISLLYNNLNDNKNDFNILEIKAIYTASVPVLKIKCNLENIIPDDIKNKIKNDYLFNFEEEILQLNFDFTFLEVNNLNENIFIPSLEIVSYIKKEIDNFKEIKPIVLFLKRYMKINRLNSSFHGGISSYSLFLLVNAFIKSMNFAENSIGQNLYGFFEFYSNFNFGIYSINVSQYNPFILLNELHESGILLIDPITKLNVAKSSFKVDQIKSALMKGMIIIRNIIYKKIIENNNNNADNDKNIFLDELFKYKIGSIIIQSFPFE